MNAAAAYMHLHGMEQIGGPPVARDRLWTAPATYMTTYRLFVPYDELARRDQMALGND